MCRRIGYIALLNCSVSDQHFTEHSELSTDIFCPTHKEKKKGPN